MKNSSLAYEPEISLISMEPRKKLAGGKKKGILLMLLQFHAQEDPLEEGMATHSSIPAWSINHMDRGAWWAPVQGVTKIQDLTEQRTLSLSFLILKLILILIPKPILTFKTD